ncbi:MAG: FAD:protein FMN transferase [Bacteroidales bacterium]|nr:FAD:protein FMN transferase [Bacteroidales bacterium]
MRKTGHAELVSASHLCLGLLLVLALNACQPGEPSVYIKLAGPAQGTAYHVSYESSDSVNLQPGIDTLLRQFDLSLSAYEPASIISAINRDEENVELDDYFVTCYLAAAEISRASDGAFDLTVAPVVNAWGFGFTDPAEVNNELIDSLLQFIGMDKVRLENGHIIKEKPGVMLDVNAIAQGYAVDVVAAFLESKGIRNYLVEIGGEVAAKGINDRGEYWRVGIDKPIDGLQLPGVQLQAVVALKNKALATSGNYRRFYVKDGVKYSHTIDPRTGYPVDHNLLSATILADDCMTADGFATACMVMGVDRSIQLLESREDLEGYLIYHDDEEGYGIYYTSGMKKILLRSES